MEELLALEKVNKDHSSLIENVYLVDGPKFNLRSTSQLFNKGNKVSFNSTYDISNLETEKLLYPGRE